MAQLLRSLSLITLLALAPGMALAGGNVTAANKGGSLVIVGDGSPNGVFITQGGSMDEFVVTGTGGTTVNGLPGPAVINGITGNIKANLDDGGDDLDLDGVGVPSRLLVKLDPGDDTFLMTNSTVTSNASVGGSKGADSVTFSNVQFGSDLKVKGEGDPDGVLLDNITVTKNTTVTGGDGDDGVTVQGGSQFIGRFKASTDRGFDGVTLSGSTFTNKVDVALGSENDDVTLSSITAQNLVTLNGGSGVDTYTDGGGNAFNGPPLVLKKIEIIN